MICELAHFSPEFWTLNRLDKFTHCHSKTSVVGRSVSAFGLNELKGDLRCGKVQNSIELLTEIDHFQMKAVSNWSKICLCSGSGRNIWVVIMHFEACEASHFARIS